MRRTTTCAARLQELRVAAGLTQAQLAERAGLPLSAFTRFEQGVREPSLAAAAALASALDVKVDDLLKPPAGAREAVVRNSRGRPPKATPATPPAVDLEATGKSRGRTRKKE